MSNKERFKKTYIESLIECINQYGADTYFYGVDEASKVAERMFNAMDANTFNHDSHAYRRAAKKLGIKPTRTAILEFWNRKEENVA